MKAVVTGSTGFVGRWLVDELLRYGDEVIAFVRDKKNVPKEWYASSKVTIVESCLADYKKLMENSDFVEKADLFFHFAWNGTSGINRNNIDIQMQNIDASCDAIKLAKKMGCKRYIYAGSIMEYDALKSFQTESLSVSGNVYSMAKATADYMLRTIAKSEEIEYVKVIISNIFGVGEKSERFINSILKKMMADEEILLSKCTQRYDFIYVSDAVKAIALVGKKGINFKSYYIGNSEQHSLKEFVMRMYETIGSQSKLNFGAIKMCGEPLDYKEFNTHKLKDEMNFVPEIKFEDGIKLLSKWIEEGEKSE